MEEAGQEDADPDNKDWRRLQHERLEEAGPSRHSPEQAKAGRGEAQGRAGATKPLGSPRVPLGFPWGPLGSPRGPFGDPKGVLGIFRKDFLLVLLMV